MLCNAVVALSTPALPELIRRVIDDIFIDKNENMLVVLPIVAVLIMFIRALGTFGANVSINLIGQKIVGSLQNDLYLSLLKSDISYINLLHSARFISNFTADSNKATRNYVLSCCKFIKKYSNGLGFSRLFTLGRF